LATRPEGHNLKPVFLPAASVDSTRLFSLGAKGGRNGTKSLNPLTSYSFLFLIFAKIIQKKSESLAPIRWSGHS